MQQTKFKIVIPSYNNEKWCEYNLASIINQTNTNYDVLYIDDCSTDGTYEKVNAIVGNLPNWKVVKNPTNKRRGYNTSPYNPDILEFMDSDEDVLIFVDGDDWLFEDETLDKIDRYYKTNDVWMTYGQYINYPSLRLGTEILHGTPYSNETHKLKKYRSDYWRASHIRTFKWHLYKQIKKQDLLFDKTGEHYIYAEDLAASYPCLEMAGPDRIGVVDFIAYVYNSSEENRERILNDLDRDPNGYEVEMKAREFEIRNKQPYSTVKPCNNISSRLYGGLGNMLFQIAAGYSLSKKHNTKYLIHPEHSGTLHGSPRKYLADIFSKLEVVDSVQSFTTIKEQDFGYTPLRIESIGDCILDGHFQSYKYFQDYVEDIRELFAPTQDKVAHLLSKYDIQNSVSLHVRRGDYLTLSDYHYNLSLGYYTNAIDYFSGYNFTVFSDDIEWCKNVFTGNNFTFVEGTSDVEDLYLMSLCKHNIIANSTFSWWGAMLNRSIDKQVVCPDKWFGPLNKSLSTLDLYPQEWICLSETVPEVEFNLFDTSFEHLRKANGRYSSVHGKISEYVKYTNSKLEYEGISIFTDNYLNSPIVQQVRSGKKIGWVMESRQVDSRYYDQFEEYADRYDYILTHDQQLLQRYPEKTKFTIFGGSWIKTQNYGLHHKSKNVSMIYSTKNYLEGHKLRHTIAEEMTGIDLYGTGCGNAVISKEIALTDYRFSIVVENVKAQNYFTEKLVDSLLVGTIPIYWGCPNIEDFFDTEGMILVNNFDDIVNILPTLTESYYLSKIENIRTNLKLAKQYATTEDWIYRNVIRSGE
jgi:glycosyltransferase involved in cell wall biosynthesis